jgi:predicted metal-binding protein
MSSLVSDNFVKRNLKRKFHGGNSTKRKYSSKRYQKESSTGDVQTQQDENHQSTLTSWGIDPLQLSLGKIKSMNSSDKPVVIDKPTISTPAPRGLLTSGLNETEDRNSATSRYTEEEIQYFHQYCPKCSGHQMPSRIYLVRKTGANKGRFFYSCSYPPDQRCRFFLWAEVSAFLRFSLF